MQGWGLATHYCPLFPTPTPHLFRVSVHHTAGAKEGIQYILGWFTGGYAGICGEPVPLEDTLARHPVTLKAGRELEVERVGAGFHVPRVIPGVAHVLLPGNIGLGLEHGVHGDGWKESLNGEGLHHADELSLAEPRWRESHQHQHPFDCAGLGNAWWGAGSGQRLSPWPPLRQATHQYVFVEAFFCQLSRLVIYGVAPDLADAEHEVSHVESGHGDVDGHDGAGPEGPCTMNSGEAGGRPTPYCIHKGLSNGPFTKPSWFEMRTKEG